MPAELTSDKPEEQDQTLPEPSPPKEASPEVFDPDDFGPDGAEKPPAEAPADDEIDSAVRALAESYGFSDEDLEGLDTEAVERIMDLVERRGSPARQPSETPREEREVPAETGRPSTEFSLDWGEEGKEAHEEVVVRNLEAMAAKVNELVTSQTQQQQFELQRFHDRLAAEFHGAVDEFKTNELGNSESLTKTQDMVRARLWDDAVAIFDKTAGNSRPLTMAEAVKVAHRRLFGNESTPQKRGIPKQASRKSGSGRRKVGSPGTLSRDDEYVSSEDFVSSPEIQQKLQQYKQEREEAGV